MLRCEFEEFEEFVAGDKQYLMSITHTGVIQTHFLLFTEKLEQYSVWLVLRENILGWWISTESQSCGMNIMSLLA